jgi:hypothetical protein
MTEEATKLIRRSIVCTFGNHPPIRFWDEFVAAEVEKEKSNHNYAPGDRIDDYTSYLWDANKDFGHHDIEYYVCKSGKRIYFASYNSGESYGSHNPRTTRTYLKDIEAIKAYFGEIDRMDEWYRVCGNVDATLIVDSDLL